MATQKTTTATVNPTRTATSRNSVQTTTRMALALDKIAQVSKTAMTPTPLSIPTNKRSAATEKTTTVKMAIFPAPSSPSVHKAAPNQKTAKATFVSDSTENTGVPSCARPKPSAPLVTSVSIKAHAGRFNRKSQTQDSSNLARPTRTVPQGNFVSLDFVHRRQVVVAKVTTATSPLSPSC